LADGLGRAKRFRHELFPEGPALVFLADTIVADLLAYEEKSGIRQRRRRPADHVAMVNTVYVITANLAHLALYAERPEEGLLLPTGHARGKQAGPHKSYGKDLRAVLEGLAAIGVLTLLEPANRRQPSAISPTEAFRLSVSDAGIFGGDVGRRNSVSRLRLSRKQKDGSRDYVPIPDSPEAFTLLCEVDQINGGLSCADITFVGNAPVDVWDRWMVRHFSHPTGVDAPSLNYGGRLYGGFWQNMRKDQRHHIRINGEPVVELDYGQVFPRLAYAMAGAVSPPEGEDLYYLPELVMEVGERHRDGIKRGFNALLWGAGRWNDEITALLPRSWPASRFRKALATRHPAIAGLLSRERISGYLLSRLESDIIVAVVLACMGQGITALPIHDAVLVPASALSCVMEIMTSTSQVVAGATLPVTHKSCPS